MNNSATSCVLDMNQILDEYFLENRHRLLEIAAFLDRLDRKAAWGAYISPNGH